MSAQGFFNQRFSNASVSKWADPFLLPSSSFFPKRMESAWDYCLFLYAMNENYRRSVIDTAGYFVTGVKADTQTAESEREWNVNMLEQKLDILSYLKEGYQEINVYGNLLSWIYFPFTRLLIDERDGEFREYSLSMFPDELLHYNMKEMVYEAPDPREIGKPQDKRAKVKFKFRDREVQDVDRISIRNLSVRYTTIWYNPLSNSREYVWRFSEEPWYQNLRKGHAWFVNEVPMQVLKAASLGCDFIFDKGAVFHLRNPTIEGVTNSGWGVPEILWHVRNMHSLQVYRRMDEAVGLDYMLPLRIVAPGGAKGGDVGQYTNLKAHSAVLRDMIAQHRKEPTGIFATPFPVVVSEINANGRQLVTKDIMEAQTNRLLSGAGYPVGLFQGNQNWQSGSAALAAFESTNRTTFDGMSRLADWVAKSVQMFMGISRVKVSLERPSTKLDESRKAILSQLMAAGEIPRDTVFPVLGVEGKPSDLKRRRIQEDIESEKIMQKEQQAYEREMTMGSLSDQIAAESGAAGAAPAGGAALTPAGKAAKAHEKAQEWLQMEEGVRRKDMASLEATDNQLYAMAKQAMDEMRRSAEAEGRRQLSPG